jgi:hypothetical protein
MMNPTSPERVRQDCRLIRQTLLKLALPRLLLRAIVSAIAVVVWLYVAARILDFGRGISYGALQPLGQQTVDLLNRINPYLWWAVVAIWSLIVFFALRAWLRNNMEAARTIPVHPDTMADLAPRLSDEVIEVMRWCWGTREEPFSIGDLERSLRETRHGRIAKIAMVREQEALLAPQPAQPPRGGDTLAGARGSRGDHYVEPRIGSVR